MPQVSRYQSIWNTLKVKHKLTLTIVPGLETRIIKALNKRKQKDTLFQFEALESTPPKKYKVRHTISKNGRIMTITLHRIIQDSEL